MLSEVAQTVLAHLPREQYENRECSVWRHIWMAVSLWSVILETLCAPIYTYRLHSVCDRVLSLCVI